MAKKTKTPAEIEKVTITMSRPVAEAVAKACEMYLRLHMGQFEDLTDELCMARFYAALENDSFTSKEEHDEIFSISIDRRNIMQEEVDKLYKRYVLSAPLDYCMRIPYRAEQVWLAIRHGTITRRATTRFSMTSRSIVRISRSRWCSCTRHPPRESLPVMASAQSAGGTDMQKMFKAIFCEICRRVAFQEQLEGGFQDTLTTQDWVTDWQVTTDFNGFPLKYPRVIDLCPQCHALYGKRPFEVGKPMQRYHV